MVLAAGIAVAASMLLLGATLNAIRPFYLNALPESASACGRGSHLRPAGVLHPARAPRPAGRRPHGRRRRLAQRATRLRRRGQGCARPWHRHGASADVTRGAADRQAGRRARAVPQFVPRRDRRHRSTGLPGPGPPDREEPPWCSSSSQDCWCSCWSSWRPLHNRRPQHPGTSPSPERASAKDSTTTERDPEAVTALTVWRYPTPFGADQGELHLKHARRAGRPRRARRSQRRLDAGRRGAEGATPSARHGEVGGPRSALGRPRRDARAESRGRCRRRRRRNCRGAQAAEHRHRRGVPGHGARAAGARHVGTDRDQQ